MEILRSVMEQEENLDEVTDDGEPFIREITFQRTKDMERFCTRLASSNYFSPVTADNTYNIAGHYLVQTGYENLPVLRRENSKYSWFPGPCTFVRHVGEADHCMLWQTAKRFCATLTDIRFLGTDDDKAIYNAISSECNLMTFHILGLEHAKKNTSDKLKDLNFPNCQVKKIMNDIFTDLYNCSDVNACQNELTELKERWFEIETRFTRKEPRDQFVKYFGKHKNEAIKFKLTKFARERACLKKN